MSQGPAKTAQFLLLCSAVCFPPGECDPQTLLFSVEGDKVAATQASEQCGHLPHEALITVLMPRPSQLAPRGPCFHLQMLSSFPAGESWTLQSPWPLLPCPQPARALKKPGATSPMTVGTAARGGWFQGTGSGRILCVGSGTVPGPAANPGPSTGRDRGRATAPWPLLLQALPHAASLRWCLGARRILGRPRWAVATGRGCPVWPRLWQEILSRTKGFNPN